MEKLSEFLKLNVFRDDAPIPDTIIEKYVQEIVVDKDNFIWKLNPSIGQADNILIEMDRNIRKNNISNKTMYHVHSSSRSYQHETLIETPIFLGTYVIPKSYMKSILGFYYTNWDFRLPNEMEIQLELI